MMTTEEVKLELTKYVKSFYEYSDIMFLDIYKEEVELRFHVVDSDRERILKFYENNKKIFKEATDVTSKDLQELTDISMRLDQDGIFFGCSSYDFVATNVVAFYLLEKYLNELMEGLPKALEHYHKKIKGAISNNINRSKAKRTNAY